MARIKSVKNPYQLWSNKLVFKVWVSMAGMVGQYQRNMQMSMVEEMYDVCARKENRTAQSPAQCRAE